MVKTYRDCFRRDIGIMRHGPPWRRSCLAFGYVLIVVMLCADVDLARVEHVPFEDVLIFDNVMLVLACTAGFAARRKLSPLAYIDPPASAETETDIESERRKWRQKFTASA